jgi:hypothetical protein
MSHTIEQKWIEYWNDLHDLIKTLNNPKLINAEFEIISLENAQQLIQDGVYKGNNIKFEVVNFFGHQALMIQVIPQ